VNSTDIVYIRVINWHLQLDIADHEVAGRPSNSRPVRWLPAVAGLDPYRGLLAFFALLRRVYLIRNIISSIGREGLYPVLVHSCRKPLRWVFRCWFRFSHSAWATMFGFYLYTIACRYLWLNASSEFVYNHQLTGLSAATSAGRISAARALHPRAAAAGS